MDTKQLKRIADAIEEILRIVKKDMEPKKKWALFGLLEALQSASATTWNWKIKKEKSAKLQAPSAP